MKIGLLIAVDRELEAFLQSGEERTAKLHQPRRCPWLDSLSNYRLSKNGHYPKLWYDGRTGIENGTGLIPSRKQ